VFASLLYAFVKIIKPNKPPGSSITMTVQIHGSLAGFQIYLHISKERKLNIAFYSSHIKLQNTCSK